MKLDYPQATRAKLDAKSVNQVVAWITHTSYLTGYWSLLKEWIFYLPKRKSTLDKVLFYILFDWKLLFSSCC